MYLINQVPGRFSPSPSYITLAEAGLALVERCHQRGRVLLLGTDANAIASLLDTWSARARPREESCLARWTAAGLLDTFRLHHPSWRVATYFTVIGGGASRLDYILAPAPPRLLPSSARACAGAAGDEAGGVSEGQYFPNIECNSVPRGKQTPR